MNNGGVATKPANYVAAIDGLRAIAVVAVVAFHIGMPGVSGGFSGVDVFFVISGYLITRLLQEEFHARGTISLADFYARRVRRLLPALSAMLLVSTIAGAYILLPDELPRLRSASNAVAIAVSNLVFVNFAGGYFDPAAETMPLLHTWSLAVEEQYYLVWPLMLVILGKIGRRDGFDRRLMAVLMVVFSASYAACLWYSYEAPEKAFYLMPLRAWELACGALAQQLQPRLRLRATASRTLRWTGIILILAFVAKPDMAQPFPGVGALFPVLGCSLLLLGLGGAGANSLEAHLLGSKPMRTIGLLSYSWYLWHWPILALTRAYFLDLGGLDRNIPLMLLALAAAALSYRFIETPVRSGRIALFRTTRGALYAGLGLTLFTLAITSLTIHFKIQEGKHINEAWGASDDDPLYGVSKCSMMTKGDALIPAQQCTYGNVARAPSILVWGDSHSGALSDLIQSYATEQQQSVLLRSTGACPALPGVAPFSRSRANMSCAHNNRMVENEALALAAKGTKGVLLASRWNAYIGLTPTDPGGGHYEALLRLDEGDRSPSTWGLEVGKAPMDHAGSMLAMEKSLRTTLHKLVASGLRVLILAPIPELPYMATHCLYRRSADLCVIQREAVDARRADVVALFKRLASEYPNVRIMDPIDEFCDATKCYTFRHGILLYGDDDHMSKKMALYLYARNRDTLRWLAQLPESPPGSP